METYKKEYRKMPTEGLLPEMLKAANGDRLPKLGNLEYAWDESLMQLFREVELDVVADVLLYGLASLEQRDRVGAVSIFFKSWDDDAFKEPICNFCTNAFTGEVCNPSWATRTRELARKYAERALAKCEETKRQNEECDCYDPVCAVIPDNAGTAAIALETEYGYYAIGVSVNYSDKKYQGDAYVMLAVIAQCMTELHQDADDCALSKACDSAKKILSGLLPMTGQMMETVAKMFDEEKDPILDKWKKWLYSTGD